MTCRLRPIRYLVYISNWFGCFETFNMIFHRLVDKCWLLCCTDLGHQSPWALRPVFVISNNHAELRISHLYPARTWHRKSNNFSWSTQAILCCSLTGTAQLPPLDPAGATTELQLSFWFLWGQPLSSWLTSSWWLGWLLASRDVFQSYTHGSLTQAPMRC
jgi:hypothetical protein